MRTHFGASILAAFGLASVLAVAALPAGEKSGAPIEWIDVHVHPIGGRLSPDFYGAVASAVSTMQEAGIRHMVLMSPPQPSAGFDYTHFLRALKEHGRRFSFLRGGGKFQRRARQPTIYSFGFRLFVSLSRNTRVEIL